MRYSNYKNLCPLDSSHSVLTDQFFKVYLDRAMADDDIWASDSEQDQLSYDQQIAEREWNKMNEVHGNVSLSICQLPPPTT